MKILYLAPHLSTGGMPAFLLRRIQEMQEWTDHEIYVAEWTKYSDTYTVQRDQIEKLLDKDHFVSLGDLDESPEVQYNQKLKLIDLCYEWGIDIIHIDEIPEGFDGFNPFALELQQELYDTKHPWRIVETCHNIWFNPSTMKKILPDGFAMVSPEHELKTFKDIDVTKSLITFPWTKSKSVILKDRKEILGDFGYRTQGEFHIINIGLWTQGKNQKYAIDIARTLYAKYGHTYQFHFVGNQASNFSEYWQPLMNDLPPNCKVWGEREDTSTLLQMSDLMLFTSNWECNPIVLAEAASLGIPTMAFNLPQYGDQWTETLTHLTGVASKDAESVIGLCFNQKHRVARDSNSEFAERHEDLYKKLLTNPKARRPVTMQDTKPWHVEINRGVKFHNNSDKKCQVSFKNARTQEVLCSMNLEPNHWGVPYEKFFMPWQIDFQFEGSEPETWTQDLTNGVVNIEFGSSSLGDTLAFIEAVVTFKEEHKLSKVNLLTYKNWLFDWTYYNKKGIYAIPLGTQMPSCDATYEIGVHMANVGQGPAWFEDKNPRDWRKIYLGDIATDVLGLEPIGEIRPKLSFMDLGKPVVGKYIVIATQSTAQAKYWNNPTGWQEIVDWHKSQGYKVYIASSEENGYMGNFYPKGAQRLPSDLQVVANYIKHADYFIGISSGLSWLAWSLNAKIVLISGFTPEICEFTDKTLRIIDKTVCNSCWEWDHFDRNNWNWCPKHEATEKQFECTKSISGSDVIAKIKTWTK
jgi:autotransporter strand-loop-strand O-heptosyltransferase